MSDMSRGVIYSSGLVKHCALQTKKTTHVSGCAAFPCSLASAREKVNLGKHIHVLLVGSSVNMEDEFRQRKAVFGASR